jgi:GT2 family glycosyltransferase
MHISALTTCHNRVAATRASLADLYAQELPEGVTLSVTIVDDGSSDGTSDAVRREFPHATIVAGDGSLFWAGGMRHGWQRSVSAESFDRLLVFNDDVRLRSDAVRELLDVDRHARETRGPLTVVTGAFTDESGSRVTYGGYRRRPGLHPLRFDEVMPMGRPQTVDTLNMNCALISKETVNAVGFLADHFHHCGADIEYGLRVGRAGGSVWLTSKPIGWCQDQPDPLKATGRRLSVRERYRIMTGPKGQSLAERARFCREYGGLLWPVWWLGPFVKPLLASGIPEVFGSSRGTKAVNASEGRSIYRTATSRIADE